jgi:hypothetical protein
VAVPKAAAKRQRGSGKGSGKAAPPAHIPNRASGLEGVVLEGASAEGLAVPPGGLTEPPAVPLPQAGGESADAVPLSPGPVLRALGCAKCRRAPKGCVQCRRPDFVPRAPRRTKAG